ncbi:glutathione S-transferase [Mesorhizobium sp. M1C.F.Ca.ET.193.01.1.1]|uniref:glutathione S-transferase n=2 Tax=Mesorhizobium TaxID=68287 RepID=UPI000FD59DAD|nr:MULTISPECIES: glutathione S-transferase [unclassified Mesorhizobium]TGT03482.1 glutathione S-transferase [bacterium M00.F.Ca.ET.177.01.1.1]TGQ56165.1 glutathione S-transferase [Mesorhizobium sp. M1C.F.Ca.ET.210.01.1.1]TGQ75250.1 glutathione S-transferase [Mesorhizobium sp. M1C.F.Ca.ET.212.01.1.1]TGR13662.1 glutathione S-transferase [Mesorhizobium sp. M1C.F.Ca.ET.204.01.1.1]TGR33937.1 glutathione S-transferase [Mesorhizobium sp. M1C.F.Ca.ET.196.01.1.1]
MKLFDGGRAPNPRRVRVFLAEKGLSVPLVPVDMGALEHREQPVASRNALRRLPVLELDDGTVITESIAICRYFEELHPEPALFGKGALGKAKVEMWQRRMEFNLLSCVAAAFRHIHPAMKDWEVPQIPEWGEANKPKAIEFLRLLDRELADREFAAGDTYSVADITGLIAIDFMKPARIKVPEDCANVLRWHSALSSRPSAAA